jgi:hypothetical protein
MDDKFRDEMNDASQTLYLLANQFGVKCGRCGIFMKGFDKIGSVSYMAYQGTGNYQARPYCKSCTTEMLEDE